VYIKAIALKLFRAIAFGHEAVAFAGDNRFKSLLTVPEL
jgi:hypothetical protein